MIDRNNSSTYASNFILDVPRKNKRTKRRIRKVVTNAAMQILKTKAEHVIIVYNENPQENWFISGKQL